MTIPISNFRPWHFFLLHKKILVVSQDDRKKGAGFSRWMMIRNQNGAECQLTSSIRPATSFVITLRVGAIFLVPGEELNSFGDVMLGGTQI